MHALLQINIYLFVCLRLVRTRARWALATVGKPAVQLSVTDKMPGQVAGARAERGTAPGMRERPPRQPPTITRPVRAASVGLAPNAAARLREIEAAGISHGRYKGQPAQRQEPIGQVAQ